MLSCYLPHQALVKVHKEDLWTPWVLYFLLAPPSPLEVCWLLLTHLHGKPFFFACSDEPALLYNLFSVVPVFPLFQTYWLPCNLRSLINFFLVMILQVIQAFLVAAFGMIFFTGPYTPDWIGSLLLTVLNLHRKQTTFNEQTSDSSKSIKGSLYPSRQTTGSHTLASPNLIKVRYLTKRKPSFMQWFMKWLDAGFLSFFLFFG